MMINATDIVSIDLKGNLLFSIAPEYDRQFLITSWNSGMHFYVKSDEGWQQEDIDTGLMLSSDENIDQEDEPISVYLKQLPDELIKLAKPYRYRQFLLLQLMAQNPPLLDLFKHSANLLWMCVVEAQEHSWTMQEQVNILQQKREKIIETFNCEASKKSVRFVNKIELHKGIQSEFKLIKKCLVEKNIIEAFKHWPAIPIQALAVALRFPYFLDTKILINEIDIAKTTASHKIKFFKLQEIADDIERMARAMGRDMPLRYKEHINSERELHRIHINWITRFNQANAVLLEEDPHAIENRLLLAEPPLSRKKIVFPICPLGDLEGVIQIKNSHELITEGVEMNHCVGSYIENALQENSYFYKMLTPERATLQVKINRNKVSVVQFKLANNEKPSPASYVALHEAFRDYH